MRKPLRYINRSLPRGLFGRSLMILVLPMVLLQVVVGVVFTQRHYDKLTEQMAGAVAIELQFAIETVENAPDVKTARRALQRISVPLGFELSLQPDKRVEQSTLIGFFDLTGREVAQTLRRVDSPIAVDLVTYDDYVAADIATGKGALGALIPRQRVNARKPYLLFIWMTVTALFLTLIAVVFLRKQVRPIRDLARVASAFGRGRSLPFRPSGADEVRRAGAAFLDMRGRIERHVEQRTRMLSGVSHDLRTPLTRIKLALAMGEETSESAEITRDIGEMEQMLDAFLAFSRGEDGEESAPTSPVDLAEEVAVDARRNGATISIFARNDTPQAPLVEMRRHALKRGLANLVGNAAAHGQQIVLSVRLGRSFVEFTVEDDGPGIPEEMREEVMRPFFRLDEARNQDIAGTGLGLSIALDVARSHGGSLRLDTSARLGGLSAMLSIPR